MAECGIIIGRFNPPHNGHTYLIDFAQSLVDELYIFVCTLPQDDIPGKLRFAWMQELAPNATLIHITEENPMARRNSPDAHRIWAETVMKNMKEKSPDYVFASENYGWAFAEELGARFVPVDPNREHFAISSSTIRHHPLKYWNFLPAPSRPYFIKRIAIIARGESKDEAKELSQYFAKRFNTVYSISEPESFLGNLSLHPEDRATPEPPSGEAEFVHRVHRAMEQALSRQAQRFLFLPKTRLGLVHTDIDRLIFVSPMRLDQETEIMYQIIERDKVLRKKTALFRCSQNLHEEIEADILTHFAIDRAEVATDCRNEEYSST